MATAYDVVLREVSGTPSTVLLYPLDETSPDRSAYDVFLYEVSGTPSTVLLYPVPGVAEAPSGGGTEWFGAGSATIALTTAGAGRRDRLGAGSVSIALTTAGVGTRGRFGAGSAAAVAFTTAGAGLRERFGAGDATIALTTAGAGVRGRFGAGSALVVFTSTAAGYRIRFGAGSATIRFRAYSGNPYLLEAPMATIALTVSLTLSDAALDDDSTPPVMVVEKTIAGLVAHAQKRFVVNAATATLWSSSAVGEALSSFSFLAVWSSAEVELELTCNDGHASEAIFTVTLAPNVPFFLGSDDSRYNGGDFSGTADVVDLIRVKNNNAADAVVNLILAA